MSITGKIPRIGRKALSLLLVLSMLFSLFPLWALASPEDEGGMTLEEQFAANALELERLDQSFKALLVELKALEDAGKLDIDFGALLGTNLASLSTYEILKSFIEGYALEGKILTASVSLSLIGSAAKLNDVLFGKNQTVTLPVTSLSGTLWGVTVSGILTSQNVIFQDGIMGQNQTINNTTLPAQSLSTKVAAQDLNLYVAQAVESMLSMVVAVYSDNLSLTDSQAIIDGFQTVLSFSADDLSTKLSDLRNQIDNASYLTVKSGSIIPQTKNYTALGVFDELWKTYGAGYNLIATVRDILFGTLGIDGDALTDLTKLLGFVSDITSGAMFEKYGNIDFSDPNNGASELTGYLIDDLGGAKAALNLLQTLSTSEIGKLIGLDGGDIIGTILTLLGMSGDVSGGLGDIADGILPGLGGILDGILGGVDLSSLKTDDILNLLDSLIAVLGDLKTDIDDGKVDITASYHLISELFDGSFISKYESISFEYAGVGADQLLEYLIKDMGNISATLVVADRLLGLLGLNGDPSALLESVLGLLGMDNAFDGGLESIIGGIIGDGNLDLGGIDLGGILGDLLGGLDLSGMSLKGIAELIDSIIPVLTDLRNGLAGIKIDAMIKMVEDIASGRIYTKYENLRFDDIAGDIDNLLHYVQGDLYGALAILQSIDLIDSSLSSILGQSVSDLVKDFVTGSLPGVVDGIIGGLLQDTGISLELGDTISGILEPVINGLGLGQIIDVLSVVSDVFDVVVQVYDFIGELLGFVDHAAGSTRLALIDGEDINALIQPLNAEIVAVSAFMADSANGHDAKQMKLEQLRLKAEGIKDFVKEICGAYSEIENFYKWAGTNLTKENIEAFLCAVLEHYRDEFKSAIAECVRNSNLPLLAQKVEDIAGEIRDLVRFIMNPDTFLIEAAEVEDTVGEHYIFSTSYDDNVYWTELCKLLKKLGITPGYEINWTAPSDAPFSIDGSILKSDSPDAGEYQVKVAYVLTLNYKGCEFRIAALATTQVLVTIASEDPDVPSPSPDPVTYTVTFDPNGGALAEGDVSPVTVKENEIIALPGAVKTDYRFAGWYDEMGVYVGGAGDSYKAIRNVTLTAKWTEEDVDPVTYTVTFEPNGGTLAEEAVSPVTVGEGTLIYLPAAARTDYSFAGWYDEEDVYAGDAGDIYEVTKDITLTAQWTEIAEPPDMVAVTFDPNGGTLAEGAVSPVTVKKGTDITLPAATRANHTFNGWLDGTTNAGVGGASYTVTGNVTLTASWTDNSGQTGPVGPTGPTGPTGSSNPTDEEIDDDDIALSGMFSLMWLDVESDDGIVYYYEEDNIIFVPFCFVIEGKIYFFGNPLIEYFVKPNPKEFSDIAGHWAFDNILFTASREAFQGYPGGEFRQDIPMTRAMFATVLARMALADVSGYESRVFDDVDPDSWFGPAVAWALDKEIVLGDGNNKFNPDSNITRQEIALMIVRFLKYMGIALPESDFSPFEDENLVSGWALDAVLEIQKYGVVEGKPGNLFDPQANSTRAEIATILYRIIKFAITEEYNSLD
ncbi:MAG: InlB B-repeat-containing protein [Oscillospiraceae bacterium]|nr:InlB B-repeat-containing protein [Oscillospiraceae bacterium]